MVKLVVLFRATQSGDFERRFSRNVELLRKMPGAQRVEAGTVLGGPAGGVLYQRVAEVFFDDFSALDAAMTSPEGVAAGKDLMAFARDAELLFVEASEGAQAAGPLSTKNLEAYLDNFSIQAEIIYPGKPTPSVPAAAEALGVDADQIVKTVIFLAGERPFLVYGCGVRRVDATKLAERLNVDPATVKLANPDQVLDLSGYKIGTVPPVGLKTPMPAFMDPAVKAHEVIYAGGGGIDALLRMTSDELQRASRAELAPMLETESAADETDASEARP